MLVEEQLSYQIRGAIYEVYSQLGFGYLEKIYEHALLLELAARGVSATCQVPIGVWPKGQVVGAYYVDVIVENRILLEPKAQTRISRADEAQLLNHLTTSGLRVGMLVNFTYPMAQIRRTVHDPQSTCRWIPRVPWLI